MKKIPWWTIAAVSAVIMVLAGNMIRFTGKGAGVVDAVAQAPAYFDTPSQVTSPPAADAITPALDVVVDTPQAARPEAEIYLDAAAASLTAEQFGMAGSAWLAAHPGYNTPEAIVNIQSHLNLVLHDYPAIETRAAFDMALQRAQRAWREEMAMRAQAERPRRPPPPIITSSRHDGETSVEIIEEKPSAKALADAYYREALEVTMGGTYIGTPSWEAIKQGRRGENILPVDPSRVVPQVPSPDSGQPKVGAERK